MQLQMLRRDLTGPGPLAPTFQAFTLALGTNGGYDQLRSNLMLGTGQEVIDWWLTAILGFLLFAGRDRRVLQAAGFPDR